MKLNSKNLKTVDKLATLDEAGKPLNRKQRRMLAAATAKILKEEK